MATFPEVRQLVLNTQDIGWHTAGVPSQTAYYANSYVNPSVGEVNNRLTDAIWYRVNLEQLLGREMWDSYSQYNVILRSWTVNNCADIGSNTTTNGENYNDRSLFLMMSGLHWTNNYSVSKKQMDPEAILGVYATTNISATEGFTQYFNNVGVQTFDKKSGPIVDIRVRTLRTCDMKPPIMNGNTSNTIPTNNVHWNIVCDICPVVETRTSIKNVTTF